MVAFLVGLLLVDGLFLIGVILLQAGKGGGLAAVGGGASTDNFIGGRQAATVLTRSTWIASAIFLGLALMLAVISSRGTTQSDSLLQRELQGPAATPQPLELPGTEADAPATIPGTEGGFEGEEPATLPGTGEAAEESGTQLPVQP